MNKIKIEAMETEMRKILLGKCISEVSCDAAIIELLALFSVSKNEPKGDVAVCDTCDNNGGRSAKLGMGHLSCPKCGR